jgi:hypothetical protein
MWLLFVSCRFQSPLIERFGFPSQAVFHCCLSQDSHIQLRCCVPCYAHCDLGLCTGTGIPGTRDALSGVFSLVVPLVDYHNLCNERRWATAACETECIAPPS